MADLSKYSDENIIDVLSSDAEAELRNRGYDYGWFKKDKFVGCIYILVNPAFKDLVKIGYADDVQKRLKTLNGNSGLPDPFHCYAVYKVRKRLEDLRLHDLLDSLDSTLRHSKNREFFEMDAEKAYGVLSAIAQINGDEEQLVKNPFDDEYFYQSKVTNRDTLSGIRPVADSRDVSSCPKGMGNNYSLPNGLYSLSCNRRKYNEQIYGSFSFQDGVWTILKGSKIGFTDGLDMNRTIEAIHSNLVVDANHVLLEDYCLGKVSPYVAASVVMFELRDGWRHIKDSKGQCISIYRKR